MMDGPTIRRARLPLIILFIIFLFVYACVPAPITNLKLIEVRRLPASALPRSSDLREKLMADGGAVWRLSLQGDAGWVGGGAAA